MTAEAAWSQKIEKKRSQEKIKIIPQKQSLKRHNSDHPLTSRRTDRGTKNLKIVLIVVELEMQKKLPFPLVIAKQ